MAFISINILLFLRPILISFPVYIKNTDLTSTQTSMDHISSISLEVTNIATADTTFNQVLKWPTLNVIQYLLILVFLLAGEMQPGKCGLSLCAGHTIKSESSLPYMQVTWIRL